MKINNEKYGFIYITINDINGKKYIGQRCYHKKGWEDYLGSGIHLKRAIDKYGKEHFSRQIIEECDTKEILDEREIYWINYYDAVKNDGFYNIAIGGDGGNTIAGYTTDEKEALSNKLSSLRKGIINVGEENPMAKKVICLNTMEIFNTTVEAAKYANTSDAMIQQCCANKRLHTAGTSPTTGERLQWQYYEEGKEYVFVPYKRVYKGCPVMNMRTGVIYSSVGEAAKMENCSKGKIQYQCKNENHKNREFKYI